MNEKRVVKTYLDHKPSDRAYWGTAALLFLVLLMSVLHWSLKKNGLDLFSLSRRDVFEGQEYYRILTNLFIHSDVGHLLSNLVMFSVLSYFVLGYFSLWVFPISGFFVGMLASFTTVLSLPADASLLGLSGVVYWLGGFWLMMYFLLDEVKSVRQRLLRVLGVGIALFMPTSAFDPSVSYESHFWGFIGGLITALIYYMTCRSSFLKMREFAPDEENEFSEVIDGGSSLKLKDKTSGWNDC